MNAHWTNCVEVAEYRPVRGIVCEFKSYAALEEVLERGSDEHDLAVPCSQAVSDGEWLVVTVIVGDESTTVAGRVDQHAEGCRVAFEERDWWPLSSGSPPLLHGAAARFRCDVSSMTVAGTHTLILGAVTRAERGATTPLAYTRRGYVAPLTTERLAA